MFHHILVPLDGSPVAESALPAALSLAERFGSRLTLLHVVGRASVMGDAPAAFETWEVLAREQGEAYLQRLCVALQQTGYSVQRRVTVADRVAEAILDEADSVAADMVAMSTHGRGGLGRFVFGSVADKVVRQARLPVLVVRGREATPGAAWLQPRPALVEAHPEGL